MPAARPHTLASRARSVRNGVAASAAFLLAACGGSDDAATADGSAIVVRVAPDTPDVAASPLGGVWLAAVATADAPGDVPTLAELRAAGAVESKTDGSGRASFGQLTGAVRICEFGTGDVPTEQAGSCVDAAIGGGSPTALSIGDAGLSA